MVSVLYPVRTTEFAILLILVSSTTAFAANAFKGQPLYEQHCADCHETSGRTWIPTAPNFRRKEKMNVSDITLMNRIKKGVGVMPSYQGILKDSEIRDVIAYMRTLM